MGVCILTETHLRKRDLQFFKIANYDIVSDYCRDASKRIGGGVLIIAHKLCNIEKFVLPNSIPSPLETCSVKLFTTLGGNAILIVTGIYIPSGKTRKSLRKASTHSVRRYYTGIRPLCTRTSWRVTLTPRLGGRSLRSGVPTTACGI